MNRSRKSFRTFGLSIVLVLTAALGSAATIGAKALPAGFSPPGFSAVPKVGVGPRKISLAGVRPSQSFACTTLGIGCNTTVNGDLTSDDCRLPVDQSFYDAWTFQATAGQTVQITMQSTTFDTFLFLLDPSGIEVEDNDDYPGGGTNSRISYSITASGTYTIYANSFAVGETGAYSLELVCSQSSPSAALVTLPAAASLHGAPPTFFHSDVSVFNPSATQGATVTARYRCFTGACGNAVQTFTLTPREMRVFEDIVGTLFGAAETGGAVEFSGNVLVDSRLYTPSRPAPTVGMYVPGLSAAEAYAEAVLTSLSYSTNLSTGFRTNVGIYNGNDVAQTVTFTLYNPQGVQIGQTSQLVAARTPFQINNIAPFVGITTDVPSFYCVVRGDGVSKNYVYAAVLDNQSQDLIFVKGANSRLP
ncbi:MAG TPA: PPC domain-containing protein [Thermoanaerobaculia bacterium]